MNFLCLLCVDKPRDTLVIRNLNTEIKKYGQYYALCGRSFFILLTSTSARSLPNLSLWVARPLFVKRWLLHVLLCFNLPVPVTENLLATDLWVLRIVLIFLEINEVKINFVLLWSLGILQTIQALYQHVEVFLRQDFYILFLFLLTLYSF